MNNKKEKVLLIVPPVTTLKSKEFFNVNFPMGLGYIAAVLENHSYDVSVLDAVVEKPEQEGFIPNDQENIYIGMTFKEIREFAASYKPNYVGITSMFSVQADNAYKVADTIKSIDESIPVILGGAHATSSPQEVLNNKSIDFVVLGEGEGIIVSLLKTIQSRENFDTIDGIAYRDSNGRIVISSAREKSKIIDIDSIPFPARHIFSMEKYFRTGERHGIRKTKGIRSASILTSRGCPYSCNFCSAYLMFGRKVRYRSPEKVLAEIDELVKKYRVNDLYLSDDQYLGNRKNFTKILDGIIDRGYNLSLDAPNGTSPWMLNEEILHKMKQAGFRRVSLAIESGSQFVLDNIIKKPVKINQLPSIVAMIRRAGLEVSAFLVVGNVSENHIETFEQMKESFDLMRRLKIRKLSVSFLSPHAGSRAFEVVKKRGLISDDYLDNPYGRPVISSPLWTIEQLEDFVHTERIKCALPGNFLRCMFDLYLNLFPGTKRAKTFFVMSMYSSTRRLFHFVM